jgi:transposase
MFGVETIRKVRLALSNGESIHSVAQKYHMSRNTVRKISRTGQTGFVYSKRESRCGAVGPFIEKLGGILEQEMGLPVKNRRTIKKIFEQLQREGYEGGYDAVRRHVKDWREEHRSKKSAYVPLVFAKGEAFQFDWSDETVELGGALRKVCAAQVRLCHSRMRFCMAFPRQEMSMVMEAHIKAHEFFGGLCGRGIYDNPKTIVSEIGKGKEREYNRRFLQMSSHYLFEPCACTPSSGWEKGQVENQVGTNRRSVFVPRLKFECFEELNAHLREQMIVEARNGRHPEFSDKSVFEVYEEEKPYLIRQSVDFAGYVTEERRAGIQCLVRFDGNQYSVPCEYAGRGVSVRIYAGRIELAYEGSVVCEHKRCFEKGRYILNPLHYLPLLERKPGALRNGRPFLEWRLPEAIRRVWEYLKRYPDWDRQMSGILSVIPVYGLESVEVACETALEEGVASEKVVLNHLTRLTEESSEQLVSVPEKLKLTEEPRADCAAYERLMERSHVA